MTSGDRHLRLFLGVGGSSALGLLLNLVAAALVARLLGATGFGLWTLVSAAGALLNNVLLGWTHAPTVRFGAEEWATERSLARTFGGRVPVLALSLGLIVILLLTQPGAWLVRLFELDRGMWWMVALSAAATWVSAEAQATLRATDRLALHAALVPLARGAPVAALLGLSAATPTLSRVVLAVTLPPLLLWASAWVLGLRRAQVRSFRLPADDAWRQLRYGWAALPAFAVGYVSEWGDHVLLRHWTTPADVGIFGLAYQVFTAVLVANGLFTTVLQPRLVVAEMRTPGTLLDFIRTVIPTVLTLWMILSLWVIAAAPSALHLVGGRAFDGATRVVTVLSVALPASVMIHLYGMALDVQRRLPMVFRFTAAVAVLNVLLSVLLIPRLGAIGAAIGTVGGYLAGQFLFMRDQHRWTKVPSTPVAAVWAVGLTAGLTQVALGPGIPVRIIWAVASTCAVAVAARRVGAVAPQLIVRLFPGPLQPVGAAVRFALVAPIA